MKNQNQTDKATATSRARWIASTIQVVDLQPHQIRAQISAALDSFARETLANDNEHAALVAALERCENQLAIAFNPGGDEHILTIGRSEAMQACNEARAALAAVRGGAK